MSELTMQYYSLHPVLSIGAPMNLIIGARSAGKTYAFKEWALKSFIKSGKEFVYVRRLEEEVIAVKHTLFDDIAYKFKKEVKAKGSMLMIRDLVEEGEEPGKWERFGWIMALTEQQMWKSAAFPKVDKICFDEFIIENTRKRYIPDEVNQFMSLILTITRDRKAKIIMLSNSGFIANPYFEYYNIKNSDFKNREFVFRNGKNVVFQLYTSKINEKIMKDSMIGKISNIDYQDYALSNEFKDISDSNLRPGLIVKKVNNIANIFLSDNKCFILSSIDDGIFLEPGQNKLLKNNYTLDSFSTSEKSIYSPRIVNNLKKSLQRRTIFFSDADSRAVIINRLRS